jgi:threonine dehydratase
MGVVRLHGKAKTPLKDLRKSIVAVTPDLETKLLEDTKVFDLALSGALGTLGVVYPEDRTSKLEARTEKYLAEWGIADLKDRPLSTLSSGERRRAWIVRALVGEPAALVLDEPTANLDPSAAQDVLDRLRALAKSGVTLVLVTHHLEEVLPEFSRVLMIKDGQVFRDGCRAELLEESVVDALYTRQTQRTSEGSPHTPAEYLDAIKSSPVYDVAVKTPLEYAPGLSRLTHNRVWLKREDRQPVFSFKIRGAYAYMARLSRAALHQGVIAASAGNHAQGVALAANRLGARATIVVPRTTPSVKTEAITALGAELVLFGDNYDEAFGHAKALERSRGLTFVHPYDQPEVIAGQGTVGLEIAEQAANVDAVFVAVGGGGLIAGVALALKQLRPGVKVIGVEPDDSDAMHRSLQTGQRVTLDKVGLLADGVAVRTVGEETFRIAQNWVDEVIIVSNDAICAAVKEIFEDRRAVLEPSGALAFAGLKAYVEREKCENQDLVAIACGANLNFDRLRYVAERAQVGQRREGVLAVTIPERPGSFRTFCQAIGERNITEFNYRLGNPNQAHVFVGVAIQDTNELDHLVNHLEASGYKTLDLTGDELATTHLRHMVGGRSPQAENERLFHFDFPERAGALGRFLDTLGGRFNISLFHYRNHGSDRGRVLVGFQVPLEETGAFEEFLSVVGYASSEVTLNPGLALFLQ